MSRLEYTSNPPPQTLTEEDAKTLSLYLQNELTQLSGFLGEISSQTDNDYLAGVALNLVSKTFNVNLDDLSTSTSDTDGDFFVVVDSSGNQYKLTKANIGLAGFVNNANYVVDETTIEKLFFNNEIRFIGASGNNGLIQKNAATGRDELQIYSTGDSFGAGSSGSGVHLYGNSDVEHAGNIAFLTGQNGSGDARIIIAGGSSNTSSGGYRTNTDTRVTIGNNIFDFVDTEQDTGMLNLKGTIGRPSLLISGASSTEGDVAVPTGDRFDLGHWDGSTFTIRFSVDSAGDTTVAGDLYASTNLDVAGYLTVQGVINFGTSTANYLQTNGLGDDVHIRTFNGTDHQICVTGFSSAGGNTGAELRYNASKKLETVSDGVRVTGYTQLGESTISATSSKLGALRYRSDANNSYVDAVMQTGASTYAWVTIHTNTW
jgi:hypothetical protein